MNVILEGRFDSTLAYSRSLFNRKVRQRPTEKQWIITAYRYLLARFASRDIFSKELKNTRSDNRGEEIPDEKMPNTIGNRAEYHFAKENLFQDIFLLLKFVK